VVPHAIGAEVLVSAVDVTVAVTRPLAGDAHRDGGVHGGPQRPDLRVVEQVTDREEPLAVEPVDRVLAEHRASVDR
jgi:hypothetical protein